MRITSIEIAGTIEEGKHLPRAFARIGRKLGDDHITVEILTGAGHGDRTLKVKADDSDDQWSMAECLQEAMDGYRGSNSDINDYFRTIQMLAD